MGRIYPPRLPIPKGATKEERQKMFTDYKRTLIRCNPGCFNEDGTVKTFWQYLKYLFT